MQNSLRKCSICNTTTGTVVPIRGTQRGCWEGFRGGAAHLVIGQEYDSEDSEQAGMLRSLGFTIVSQHGLLVACRDHLVKEMEVLWTEHWQT